MIVYMAHDGISIKLSTFDPRTLTAAQLRAARALVGLSAKELADQAVLGEATVRRAEKEDGQIKLTAANAARIVETLERAGVEFIGENGGGEGVRRRR